MKFSFAFVTFLATTCMSQREPAWAIDTSCHTYDNQNIREKIKDSVLEGLQLAEDAVSVMRDHADDPWVREMSHLVLGRRDGFETRFEAVRPKQSKETLERVAAFERAPSTHLPLSNEWESVKNNRDWELYCNADRFQVIEGKLSNTAMDNRPLVKQTWANFQRCYTKEFQPGSDVKAPKMTTMHSDLVNKKGWSDALLLDSTNSVSIRDYTRETQHASSTDFCTWFLDRTYRQGFPLIDDRLLEMVKSDGFRAGFTHGVPVDGLKTSGVTFLHELTHTKQGGALKDTGIPEDLRPQIPSCYNWFCVTKMALEPRFEVEGNPDSIAMLALALRVWKMNHYVDADGVIHEIPKA
ncbi:hypothetical protein CGCA056_v003421 [Colletotrichum aenigma]|uniref:uncharacterized protein n=1 Tax=Colletotrichum aenigma TaxID=1215731 RepID=UPI00187231F7|nr:uncharacterized protein CGCA056_v003421 [Colletotrichum aenigma]KAF5525329.1 hypothetical protein CGCA056_v003421 [Colletotrichum aenigma]